MRFQLLISCNNAAFGDWPSIEVARIMRELAKRVDGDCEGREGTVRDANGNTVGTWAFIADAPAFEACNSCPWPSQCAERGSCEAGQ